MDIVAHFGDDDASSAAALVDGVAHALQVGAAGPWSSIGYENFRFTASWLASSAADFS